MTPAGGHGNRVGSGLWCRQPVRLLPARQTHSTATPGRLLQPWDYLRTRAVVMDLAGPVRPISLGGAFYFLGIMDMFTRFSWVFTLRVKSDAANIIMEWKGVAKGQSRIKLLKLRSDNEGEFTSNAFKSSMALL